MNAKRKLRNVELNEKIRVCQDFTQSWAKFFNFWGDGFEGRRVTSEDEAKCFQLMSELARKLFRFDYLMGDEFNSADKVAAVLSGAVSLRNIHDMTDSQFSKFQLDWHVSFLAMNKCLGKLNLRKPAEKPGSKSSAGAKNAQQQPAKNAPLSAASAPPSDGGAQNDQQRG